MEVVQPIVVSSIGILGLYYLRQSFLRMHESLKMDYEWDGKE